LPSNVRWGTDFADFDNDGWLDAYAAGGHLAPRYVRALGHYKSKGADYVEAGDRAYAQPTVLLHNLGEGRFAEWVSGDLRRVRMVARGTSVADFDGDGALDLVIVDLDGPVRFFRNVVGAAQSWIAIEPRVGSDGRSVLGTTVAVRTPVRSQSRTYRVSPSYASGSLTPLHFGLGTAEKVDVEIRWPDGSVETYSNLDARRTYSVRRGAAPESMLPDTKRP